MRSFLMIAAPILALSIHQLAAGQTGLPQPAQQPAAAAAGLAPADAVYRQQVGYLIGQNIGADLRESKIECDLQGLFAGISDAMSGAKPRWSEAELQATSQRLEQEMRAKAAGMAEQLGQLAERNAKQAETFLAANREREGVQQTASGLQYKVLKQGSGPAPTREDTVRFHYRGTFIDGTEFDSSYDGDPAEFPVQGVIPGWTEALQKMRVGDKWQLFVPPNLAYGVEPPTPAIEPNSLLVFEVELLGIVGQ
jgi:FKBP-type peptidyl-prolyl cis-trans isomerase